MKNSRSRKVFVDANVLIDFLVDRKYHTKYAYELFKYAEKSSVILYACSFSFAIVYHHLRKENIPHRIALSSLDRISKRTRCLPVDDSIIKQAMKSEFTDFEDAIQYFCAMQVPECEAIITRDVKGFKSGAVPAVSPAFFLSGEM